MKPEQRFKRLRRSSRWSVTTMQPRPGVFEPAPRRSWGVGGVLVAVAAVVVAVLVVVGALSLRQARQDAPNLPAVPTLTPTDAPSPTPTPTATASVDSKRPASRLALTCSDLLSDSEAAEFLGSTDIHATDSLASELGAYWSIARRVPVNQLGGLSCLWSNGVPQNSIVGSAKGYRGLSIDLYPDTADGWKGKTHYDPSCHGRYCNGTSLAGTTTVESSAEGVVAGGRSTADRTATYRDLLDKVTAAITRAGPPAAATKSDAPALPSSCEGILSDAQASEAFGAPVSEGGALDGGGGEAPPESAAEQSLGAKQCWYYSPSANNGGTAYLLQTMPGGAWVPIEYTSLDAPSGAAERLLLPGLGESDVAYERCTNPKAYEGCVVDIAVDGNWVEISGIAKAYGGVDPVKGRLQAVEDAADSIAFNLTQG